jgi:hypothetical protein
MYDELAGETGLDLGLGYRWVDGFTLSHGHCARADPARPRAGPNAHQAF